MSRPRKVSLRPHGAGRRAAGQAIVFLLLALTALAFVLIFSVDLHRIIQRKNQTQNAGDAAALAAARWQGATINLVGELNLLHALALAAENESAVHAITNMQARLCFTGPLTGLFAAQFAAKQNRTFVNPDMTTLVKEHASLVRSLYGALFDGAHYFQEPWPGAWNDYADMLDQIAADGIAAGPDNTQFFLDPSSGHTLLTKAFYEAILGRNWCWFHLRARGLLQNYQGFTDWPALPDPARSDYANSEVFGVGLHPFTCPIETLFSPETLAGVFQASGRGDITADYLATTNLTEAHETWYLYNSGDWGSWVRIRPDDNFPVAGQVRPEYDVAGGDVVVRVNASVERLTPGISGSSRSDTIVWSAAAKPFGYLEEGAERRRVTAASAFVLPAFRNVRLIPVDAATGSENNSADLEWVRHVRSHLHPYLEQGPQKNNCRYCDALALWEISELRQQGIEWLALYSGNCREPGGSGPRRGGGTRRGH